MRGLEDCFLGEISKLIDHAKRENKATKHTQAREGIAAAPLDPPVTYTVLNKPFVFVRESPSTRAPLLGFLRPGDTLQAGAVVDGWVRTAEPYDRGRYGWTLIDGAPIGLGPLLCDQRLLQG